MEFIAILERIFGKPAKSHMLRKDAHDMHATWADVADLQADTGFAPATPLANGLERYVA